MQPSVAVQQAVQSSVAAQQAVQQSVAIQQAAQPSVGVQQALQAVQAQAQQQAQQRPIMTTGVLAGKQNECSSCYVIICAIFTYRLLCIKTSYLYVVECSGKAKNRWIILPILMRLILTKCVFNRFLIFRFVYGFDTLCRMVMFIKCSNKISFRKNRVTWFLTRSRQYDEVIERIVKCPNSQKRLMFFKA